MPPPDLVELIADSLRVEFVAGSAERQFPKHEVAWRAADFFVMVHTPRERYLLELEDGSIVTAAHGGAVLIAPGIPHRLRFPREGVLSGLHLRATFLGGVDVFSYFRVPHLPKKAAAGELAATQVDLVRAYAPSAEVSFERMARRKELGFCFLKQILHLSERRVGTPARLEKLLRLKPVLDFIAQNLHRRATRDELARTAGYSPARFHTVFRETLGMAPMEYVRRQRLQTAVRLLRDETLAVGQVADRLGYSDPFHFSHQFKAALGVSPLAYRRLTQPGGAFPHP